MSTKSHAQKSSPQSTLVSRVKRVLRYLSKEGPSVGAAEKHRHELGDVLCCRTGQKTAATRKPPDFWIIIRTTAHEPDYDKLMRYRTLTRHELL